MRMGIDVMRSTVHAVCDAKGAEWRAVWKIFGVVAELVIVLRPGASLHSKQLCLPVHERDIVVACLYFGCGGTRADSWNGHKGQDAQDEYHHHELNQGKALSLFRVYV